VTFTRVGGSRDCRAAHIARTTSQSTWLLAAARRSTT
jgi:hypothetical protein